MQKYGYVPGSSDVTEYVVKPTSLFIGPEGSGLPFAVPARHAVEALGGPRHRRATFTFKVFGSNVFRTGARTWTPSARVVAVGELVPVPGEDGGAADPVGKTVGLTVPTGRGVAREVGSLRVVTPHAVSTNEAARATAARRVGGSARR